MCQTRGAKSCQQLGNERLPVGSEGPRAILCQWRGVHLNLHHPVTYQRECTSRCASLILLLVKSKVILYPHNNLQLSYPIPAVLAKSWTWGRWSVYSMLHKHCGSGVCMWQCWGSLCTGGAKWKLRFSTISYLNQVDVTASVLLTKQHMSYLCYTLCTAVNMTRSLKKTKQTNKKSQKNPKKHRVTVRCRKRHNDTPGAASSFLSHPPSSSPWVSSRTQTHTQTTDKKLNS